MRLQSTMKAQVIAKGTQDSRDGKTTYYRITILQGMESGILSCPQELYDKVNVGSEYNLNTEYNSEYKSFRVTGGSFAGKESPATTKGGN